MKSEVCNLTFEILTARPECDARIGRLHLPHGAVETPAFMPVGTQGAVKTVSSEDLEALGYDLILANTYHLHLRPGEELIERLGGLHKFMAWPHPILTDSGGYQVMSLAPTRKVTDAGVEFQSHLDGARVLLTPERSVEIQRRLGVDISVSLDVCPSYPATRDEIAETVRLTHAWALQSLRAKADAQALFGVVQGGIHEDLRRESAGGMTSLPFDGFAIGGVSVGEPADLQYPMVELTAPLLPASKPRYLLGVGHPRDIIHAAKCGVDLFDCVLPTRLGRHHGLYTLHGVANIMNSEYAEHDGPVDPGSVFPVTERYSAAYLRHLFKAGEPLAARLATLHNLAFYNRLMREIRQTIRDGAWSELERRYTAA